jgi:hypothetical protein
MQNASYFAYTSKWRDEKLFRNFGASSTQAMEGVFRPKPA